MSSRLATTASRGSPSGGCNQDGDDALTLVALGIVAFVIADMTHEGLGHGLAILAEGAKPVLLTTAYFAASGSESRWIPAGGGIANVFVGVLGVLALRLFRMPAARVRYLFTLIIAFNLLFATAYPAYSGIAAFGDWAAVIRGLPTWFWRLLSIAVSVISYYASLKLIAVEIAPFGCGNAPQALARLRRTTLIPYVAAIAIAALAGAFNPQGWKIVIAAAVPAAAAAFGFTQMDHFSKARGKEGCVPAGPMTRSLGWIITVAIVGVIFVGLLGPGIRFGPNT